MSKNENNKNTKKIEKLFSKFFVFKNDSSKYLDEIIQKKNKLNNGNYVNNP